MRIIRLLAFPAYFLVALAYYIITMPLFIVMVLGDMTGNYFRDTDCYGRSLTRTKENRKSKSKSRDKKRT